MAGECVSPGNMHKSAACTQGRGAAIMATSLAGGLTEPYKGMGPAAPTRPGLPSHAPVPLEAAQSSPLPQFFLDTSPFDGKGFDDPGHSYKLSGIPARSGGLHNHDHRLSRWFDEAL